MVYGSYAKITCALYMATRKHNASSQFETPAQSNLRIGHSHRRNCVRLFSACEMKGSALVSLKDRAEECDDIPCGDRSVYEHTSVRASVRRCLLCTTLPIYLLPWRRTDAFKEAQVPTSQLPLHAIPHAFT